MQNKIVFFFLLFSIQTVSAQFNIQRNFDLDLSPDSTKAALLEQSLNGFLTEASERKFSEKYVDTTHLAQYDFFFSNLHGIGKSRNKTISFHPPTVLKSYSFDEETYYITVSISCTKAEQQFVYKIFELKAVPFQDHYRFYCLFAENAQRLQTAQYGKVKYHYSDSINAQKATEFAEFMNKFAQSIRKNSTPLDYYNFHSLDEMLKSYGILFDANKCNFLCNDLGFTDNNGQCFVTGMNDERYLFGYLGDYLYYQLPDGDKIYYPMLVGLKTYYGGYGTSGDDMKLLKSQFRNALAENPNLNFLEAFNKKRKSSIQRHFSFYVMCAFIYEKAIEQHGMDKALELVYSGKKGEDFFMRLEQLMGIDEASFHDFIVKIIS
ncbi:MAG: hypothetical protein AB8G22_09030 [Saprospiraceae bacterium]